VTIRFVDQLFLEDGFHLPGADHPARALYSEWQHFVFDAAARGLHGLCTLGLSGDVTDQETGRAAVTLALFDRARGWQGGLNLRHLAEARFKDGRPDIRIGESRVRRRSNAYEVDCVTRDYSLELKASFTPRTQAVRITDLAGTMNAVIAPRGSMVGTIRCGQRAPAILRSETAYHDHNWGLWNWGLDLGWEWGYFHQPLQKRRTKYRHSFVVGRVTNPMAQELSSERVLLVWRNDTFSQAFLGSRIDLEISGAFPHSSVVRMPGLLAALHPLDSDSIPARFCFVAIEGQDWVEVTFVTEGVLQFLFVPVAGSGVTTVAELAGNYHVKGCLRGVPFEFDYFGFAEMAR
jgi:hypothetical protein